MFERRNRDYEARFGHTFIVCATGRKAEEMLRILERRMLNNPDDELRRGGRGATPDHPPATWQAAVMITTHVLDIARGVPAAGVTVILEVRGSHDWTPVGRGTTDAGPAG